ncbi:SigB/SigF/SigG family RNA polymerase sigma factor [Streptomyces sp. NPDC021020]|uniref:SigB/SigF/SigG family RNA polymerase sigma factor n=1 Tax=Streptomyces sp. NPDC021020 TaxID=3365109 RepID=UPI003798D806
MTVAAHATGTTTGPTRVGQDVPAAGGLPHVPDPGKVTPKDARELSKLFFDRLRTLEEGTAEFSRVRGTLIEMNMSLVRFAARRFRSRGPQEWEDIIQVGTVGLIKAIDRFDLSRETEFTTFAIPYIVGETKRFFRDTSWAVHVPRRLQELRLELAKTRDHLTMVLDAPPTVGQVATSLGIGEDEVVGGMLAANGYTAGSLDLPTGDDGGEGGFLSYAETIGAADPALGLFENLHTLGPLLDTLDDRERRILRMRFGQELTQSEIGGRLGLSQMHVSRLLARILAKLRAGMSTDA